ncbi:MAG: KTSC domain-containing protein [Patescibacteria group bacterium]|mgnify:CR=1 FL=1
MTPILNPEEKKKLQQMFIEALREAKENLSPEERAEVEMEIKENSMIMNKKKIIRIAIIATTIFCIISGFFLIQKSKSVNVKYRKDSVNFSNFEYLDTSKSSFVNGAWYDSSNGHMIIKLNKNNYEYCGIPTSAWKEFEEADSFGKYYNTRIKGFYNCSDIEKENLNPVATSPYYKTCLSKAVVEGDALLTLLGYQEQNDKSWKDNEGEYPTSEVEDTLEEYQTRILLKCISAGNIINPDHGKRREGRTPKVIHSSTQIRS